MGIDLMWNRALGKIALNGNSGVRGRAVQSVVELDSKAENAHAAKERFVQGRRPRPPRAIEHVHLGLSGSFGTAAQPVVGRVEEQDKGFV